MAAWRIAALWAPAAPHTGAAEVVMAIVSAARGIIDVRAQPSTRQTTATPASIRMIASDPN
jgi:hypothetical protein